MLIEITFVEGNYLNDASTDTVFDLTDRCRACLRLECSLTPTDSLDSDSIKFCDKLAACVSGMTWPREGVPSFICGICIEKLRIAYNFQAVCLRSDQALQLHGKRNQIRSSRYADIIFDLTDRCRTCLEIECSLTPTNSSDSDSIKFCDKLAACISRMRWPKERVPSFICGMCIEKLRIAYDFRTVCLQSRQTLQSQVETNEIRGSRNPDLSTITSLAECDETIEKVILSVKSEETQVQPLSQCTPVTSAATQLEQHASDQSFQLQGKINEIQSSKDATLDSTTITGLAGCDETIKSVEMQVQRLPKCAPVTSAVAKLEATQTLDDPRKYGCHVCRKESCGHIGAYTSGKCFQCLVCLEEFMIPAELIVHMRIHTGEKLYACNSCERRYINEYNFLVHIRSHMGERRFACSCCDKRFTTKFLLNIHLATHTGERWQCQICNKTYTKSSELSVHTKTHTREKFSCKVCGQKFTWSSSLNAHMRKHTGDKLFRC